MKGRNCTLLATCIGMAMAGSAIAQVAAPPAAQSQARTTEEKNTMPTPPTSQSAGHAVEHSAAASRATFSVLDTDKDGRVSSMEADADAGFDAGFASMDANGDGFVTDTEYRAQTKATGKMEEKPQP
jgi:hypothetical protein